MDGTNQLDRVEGMLSDLLKQQATPTAARWLSLGRASTYCSLSEKTLRRMIGAGKLHAYRPGRKKLLSDRMELDRLIQSASNGR